MLPVLQTIAALDAQVQQMAAQLQEQEAVNTQLNGELALARDRGQSQDLSRQVKVTTTISTVNNT